MIMVKSGGGGGNHKTKYTLSDWKNRKILNFFYFLLLLLVDGVCVCVKYKLFNFSVLYKSWWWWWWWKSSTFSNNNKWWWWWWYFIYSFFFVYFKVKMPLYCWSLATTTITIIIDGRQHASDACIFFIHTSGDGSKKNKKKHA